MIHTVETATGITLHTNLPTEAIAYVDADWIPRDPEVVVPALVIIDGTMNWGEHTISIPDGVKTDRFAAKILEAGAMHTVRLFARFAANDIAVSGRGAIATEAARLLGLDVITMPPVGERKPSAAVDFSGDPSTLQSIAQEICPLGCLVVAGERLGRQFPFNLYPDVHVRGLRVSALDPIATAIEEGGITGSASGGIITPPRKVSAGCPLTGSSWFEVHNDQ